MICDLSHIESHIQANMKKKYTISIVPGTQVTGRGFYLRKKMDIAFVVNSGANTGAPYCQKNLL